MQTQPNFKKIGITYPMSIVNAPITETVRVEKTDDEAVYKDGVFYFWRRDLYKIMEGKHAGMKVYWVKIRDDDNYYAYFTRTNAKRGVDDKNLLAGYLLHEDD